MITVEEDPGASVCGDRPHKGEPWCREGMRVGRDG